MILWETHAYDLFPHFPSPTRQIKGKRLKVQHKQIKGPSPSFDTPRCGYPHQQAPLPLQPATSVETIPHAHDDSAITEESSPDHVVLAPAYVPRDPSEALSSRQTTSILPSPEALVGVDETPSDLPQNTKRESPVSPLADHSGMGSILSDP